MAVWIFERDVFDADLIERMVAHCRSRGIAHRMIRIAPTELVLEGRKPVLPAGEPVVCYASIGAQAVAAKMARRPGVFGGTFEGTAYRTHLGALASTAMRPCCRSPKPHGSPTLRAPGS